MTHRFTFKFCQPQTDGLGDMSRSLSRIRNLVSEIEEIHRKGQQGGKYARAPSAQTSPEPTPAPSPLPDHAPVAVPHSPVETYVPEPSPVLKSGLYEEVDPFEELSRVVHLDERRDSLTAEAPTEAKICVQLSGAVALSLQIENSGETVELKQVGNLLEIRFLDGKAFHIPLKAMA
jgi:hypothetical protein